MQRTLCLPGVSITLWLQPWPWHWLAVAAAAAVAVVAAMALAVGVAVAGPNGAVPCRIILHHPDGPRLAALRHTTAQPCRTGRTMSSRPEHARSMRHNISYAAAECRAVSRAQLVPGRTSCRARGRTAGHSTHERAAASMWINRSLLCQAPDRSRSVWGARTSHPPDRYPMSRRSWPALASSRRSARGIARPAPAADRLSPRISAGWRCRPKAWEVNP